MLPGSLARSSLTAFAAAMLAVGLSAQTQNNSPAPAESEKSDTVVLKPFEVTAEHSTGYKVTSASTATRTNTALIDIPQTVDIVTKEFWDDIGATTFDQSFRYVANVYVRNRNAGSGDGVNLRGFETNGSISVDGIRMGNNKRDLIGYERLEVVKGPPSAVQGRAGGTGLLNYILKKPEIGVNQTDLGFSYSMDEYDGNNTRADFDSNYTLNPGKQQMAARVAGFWQQGNDYIKFQGNDSMGVYPSFKWQITPKTDLILVSELLKLDSPSREEGHGFAVYPEKLRRLVPIFDKSTDPITALGLPYDFNIAGPGNSDKNDIANVSLFFTHQFTDWLFFRQVGNLRYVSNETFAFTGEDNTKTVVNSTYTGTDGWRRGSTAQGDLFASYKLKEWFTGRSMVGYSYDDGSSETSSFTGVPDAPFNTLDMAAIKASGYSEDFYSRRRVSNLPRTSYTETDSYSFGYFGQQDLGFWNERILFTGGLRSDHDVTETRNKVTGARSSGANTTLNSYRYGATFKILPNLAAYVVRSVQNDAPRTIQRYNGLLAGDPRLNEFFTVSPLTELKEAGIKGEIFKGRMSFAADYWQMVRTGSVVNVLTNGVSQGQNVTYGTQTEVEGAESKGWEVSFYGSVTDRLSIIANYTDMTTSQAFTGQQNAEGWNTTTNNPGTIPLRFAPDWNMNVFAKYSFRNAKNQGWEVKAGVAAIGAFYSQLTGYGLVKIPDSQYSLDAGTAYRWKNYTFDFMVTNLTEQPFLITRDQPPRTYRFSVSGRF